MRPTKSPKSLKGPFFSRSATILRAACSPTPLMAPMPKRMALSLMTGVKSVSDWFTSGPSAFMPRASTSAMNSASLSALPCSDVSTAAMNSTG